MNAAELLAGAAEEFDRRVQFVQDDGWSRSTPCSEWDVRALVNHIVNEDLWVPPLMGGSTIEEVGDRFDGDCLGDDPKAAWKSAKDDAVAAISEEGALERTVHLSFGDTPGSEYVMQLFADHLIHGWDLARAIGAEERLDPELVSSCKEWFSNMEDAYRGAGAIAERADASDGADEQTQLLAMFGRRQ
ncbi:MAG: TIGR03086 family metal-binding protein [Actinomycetota bacterium]|nr:TIGR03086 family metal-binding protein [Actinomycetota bacterium]